MGEVSPRRESDWRRWTPRPSRTSAAAARMPAAPAAAAAPGTGRARRREVALDGDRPEGYPHVGKLRRVEGALLSESRWRGAPVKHEYFQLRSESGGNPTKRVFGEYLRNAIKPGRSPSAVMAKLMGFDAASGGRSLQKSSLPSPGANVKPYPAAQNWSCTGKFGYPSKKHTSSLSEKMSYLRNLGRGNSCSHKKHYVFRNLRHKEAQAGGTLDVSRKEELSNSSEKMYRQALLDNALVWGDKFKFSATIDHEIAKKMWNSGSGCSQMGENFMSNESMDDLQVSAFTDTSDCSYSCKMPALCTIKSSLGIMCNEQWSMAFQKVYCPLTENVELISMADSKEAEQPSPVSVLEPPTEENSSSGYINQAIADPQELHMRLELVKHTSLETTCEDTEIGGICDYFSPENEAIQLVEDIREKFGDEEERDFSYVLDILIASGIHGTEQDQLYKVCRSLDYPAGHDVFEKLEKKYDRLAQWSRSDRKLLFDTVNSILSEILAPCLDLQPWVSTVKKLGPMWGSDGLLERVLQMLARLREQLALVKPEKTVFDQKWPDLADSIDVAGRKIEEMIKDDLVEEVVLELLSS